MGDSCSIPTEELYPVTDVLIADYSSLIYEYLLFGKPVVLFVPDLDSYRSRRGFYMPIEEIPGRIVRQRELLPGAVKCAGADPVQTEAFLKRYMNACDGNATLRIAEWMKSTVRSGRISQ